MPRALRSPFSFSTTASIVGLQSAILQIKSNDPTTPTLNINLHGIGTAGQFGALEPSLVQVLRANNIPTIVGAGPNDVNINTVAYPEIPDPSSQEVLDAADGGRHARAGHDHPDRQLFRRQTRR